MSLHFSVRYTGLGHLLETDVKPYPEAHLPVRVEGGGKGVGVRGWRGWLSNMQRGGKFPLEQPKSAQITD